MSASLSNPEIERALSLLNGRLARNGAPPTGIVVCGGAALIVLNLNPRTTNDVDIVALADEARALYTPAPLPEHLLQAAKEVALTLKLPVDWLNNGPSRNEGGLFQMGLPEGFAARWTMTHDVSPGFRSLLKKLLESLGHANAAQAI